MNCLVDTHVLIWSFIDPDRLSKRARSVLLDEGNAIYYSPISLWEISLKYALGKLELRHRGPEEFYEELRDSFFIRLPLDDQTLLSFHHLPAEHKDPFDRLLVWQAIRASLEFISIDSEMEKYVPHGLRLLR